MKPFCTICLCLLITAFYLSSPTITHASSSSSSSSSSSPMLLHTKRQTTRKLSYLISDHHTHENHKIKVVDTQSDDQGVSGEGDENGDELVYHVDYHGVSTHPTPTPKHP